MDVTKWKTLLAAIDHGSLTSRCFPGIYTVGIKTRMINALEEVGFPLL